MAYIKKKKDNAYLITVSCGRDSMDKKITKSVTFRPELLTAKGHPKTEKTIEREVQRFADEFEKKILTGSYRDGATLTFEAYRERYLTEYAQLYQQPLTLQNTRNYSKAFVHDFGFMTLESLTPMFLQEYANKMCSAKKANGQPGTVAPSTVKRKLAVLSAMLSQAVRWNLIADNPMRNVQILTKEAPKKAAAKCFSQTEAEIFLSVLDNPLLYRCEKHTRTDATGNVRQIQEYQTEHTISQQLKLFFYLAMFTGCRRSELLALEWSDIDTNAAVIHITKSVCRVDSAVIVKPTKTKGSVRDIAVPASVMVIVKQWKLAQKRYRLSIGSKWCGDDFVFIQWNGARMGLETPLRAFHRIIDNYNANRSPDAPELPKIPLHGLRHTAATLLIGHGVDIRTVSGRLGHANTSTTLNIYAEYLDELDRSAADKLEDLLLRKV